uniref:Uncharacterized protein n=1 Tax=Nelumbo nucifera TaxID=4432 RepID=A0A822XP04_NELNU|nr:TPA_asm: hypothetical protein HUJ06_024807 [Nelumbo nucifera]
MVSEILNKIVNRLKEKYRMLCLFCQDPGKNHKNKEKL